MESYALLKSKNYPGAYYLAGYSVECALKACVAKMTKKHDFPDKQFAQKAYTHNLQKLIQLANLEPDLRKSTASNRDFETNWLIVKDWDETARYETVIARAKAHDMYYACVARKHGVLKWISDRW